MIQNFLLSTYYENGYQQALNDVKNWFERHSVALKYCRMYNQKNIGMLLSEISRAADVFREYGEDTEFSFEHEGNKITNVRVSK